MNTPGGSELHPADTIEYAETPLGIKAVTMCHRGLRDRNEDCVGCVQTEDGIAAAEADGMGGHGNGDIAARALCDGILHHPNDSLLTGLRAAQADMEKCRIGLQSGACFAAVRIVRDPESGAFVMERLRGGDCRSAVILPDGSVVHETEDQNFATVLRLTEPDRLTHDMSNVVSSALTQETNVDEEYSGEVETGIILPPGSIVYLASDGAHGCVNPREFAKKVLPKAKGDIRTAMRLLTEICEARMAKRDVLKAEITSGAWKKNGGRCSDGFEHLPPKDNLSAILIAIPDPEARSQNGPVAAMCTWIRWAMSRIASR